MGTMSISHKCKKTNASISHNNREFISPNVDKARLKENIYFVQQPIEDAYNEIFEPARLRYNATQKRDDRKITTSYQQHLFGTSLKKYVIQAPGRKNPQNSFYEDLVQIGCIDDFKPNFLDSDTKEMREEKIKKCEANRQKAKAALFEYCIGEEDPNGTFEYQGKKYSGGFQDRNPNFKVFNMVLHFDEASPHCHIDYISVATGYKNGMDIQNGYNKALSQMGYAGAKGFEVWRLAERDLFREICVAHDLDPKTREEEKEAREIDYMPDQYREIIAEAEEIKAEAEEIKAEAEHIKVTAIAEAEKITSQAEQTKTEAEKTRAELEQEKQEYNNRARRLKKREEEVEKREEDATKWRGEMQNYSSRLMTLSQEINDARYRDEIQEEIKEIKVGLDDIPDVNQKIKQAVRDDRAHQQRMGGDTQNAPKPTQPQPQSASQRQV